MNRVFDNPILGVAVVIATCVVLFAPTIIAHLRRIRAFQSVSALNALSLLLVVCILDSPWFLCGVIALWIVTTAWSLMGRRRDA